AALGRGCARRGRALEVHGVQRWWRQPRSDVVGDDAVGGQPVPVDDVDERGLALDEPAGDVRRVRDEEPVRARPPPHAARPTARPAPGAPGGATPGATPAGGTAPSGGSTTTTAPPSVNPAPGTSVALLDVFPGPGGGTQAKVQVGSTVYTVGVGATFATSYRV